MASGYTDYGENIALDRVFGSGDPVTWYIARFSVSPGEAGGGTELTGGGYARIAVANDAVNWPAASGGAKSNGQEIKSDPSTGAQGTTVAIAFMDAATLGNMWAYADIAAADQQNIDGANQVWSLPAGSLTLTQT